MLILKRNLLSAALASALLVAATGAQAQNADASAQAADQTQNTGQAKGTDATQAAKKRGQEKTATELGAVKVTGFRASVESAIATKRDSSSIVEVVTAEDIGKLPDVSIAESLSRLPGLTAQRVDGRAQVISIRGLGPDLSTALLNGREQVTTGDNRGVEFDQYPAELLSGVVVYKTPDATLIGQGLAGTVDMRTVRPLDQNKRVLAANARYEFNGQSSLNPDVSNHGYRASATYVDQFADHTFGVTFGIAAQSTPTQEQKFNAWGYPNYGSSTGPFVIGGSKDYVSSNKLNRLGMLGTLEFKPSENFHSTLDLSYSDFDEAQHLRGIEFPLQWSSAVLQPGYVVNDGMVTSGTFDNVKAVVRNDYNRRKAKLYNAGWNNKFTISDNWTGETDLSWSRATRRDMELESYSGTGYVGSGATDSLGFSQTPDGYFWFTPTLDYSSSQFVLTDPQGWGGGAQPNPVVQAGFINAPHTVDELKSLRLSADRYFQSGPISDMVVGVNYSDRDKQRNIDQDFLTLPNGATSAPIPQQALLGDTVGLNFLGIPSQVTYDPLYLLNNGYYDLLPVSLSSFAVPQDWKVKEKVTTGYVKFNIDSSVGSVPVTGNFGLQVVHTDQSSQGSRVQTGTSSTGSTQAGFIPVQDGITYNHYLPSLNLIFDLTDRTKMRFGLARTLARARMDQLNASLVLNHDITKLTSTDPNQSFFSATGGNARLKPTIADGVDLSLEHYFADNRGYVSGAAYYKKLRDFVNPFDSYITDFSAYVNDFLTPAQQAQLGTTQGFIAAPTNNGRGNIKGLEGSVSIPLDMVTSWLNGFGFITSASYTKSSVTLGDNPNPITVPGLSKWVINSTLYYERDGFQVRVSRRHRSEFLGEVQGISATRILREVKGGSLYDAQISYSFNDGPLSGLTILAQASNLTNEPFVTFNPGYPRQVIDYQTFGRTYLIGASYKF